MIHAPPAPRLVHIFRAPLKKVLPCSRHSRSAAAGSYLAALVMYQQLAGRDPRDIPTDRFASAGIDAALAEVLLFAAAEANERFQRSPS